MFRTKKRILVLLIQLCLLNLILDSFFVHLALFRAGPPVRAFIFTFHTKIIASSTGRVRLVALLSS